MKITIPKQNKKRNNSNNTIQNKNNNLTESSINQIQNQLRQNYFSSLQQASLNKYINYVNKDEVPHNNNIENIEAAINKPLNYAAKQVVFSNRIRKNNLNWIKKHPRKIKQKENEKINVLYNFDDNNNEDKQKFIYGQKKIYIDKFPIKYNMNYIDEVEKKFIKPFLSGNNVIYRDYIEIKKSKTPFNFIIG